MNLTPEARDAIRTEVTQFAADLNLSDEQKTRLKATIETAREKLEVTRKEHPEYTKADYVAQLKDARPELRQRVAAFLTPDQLSKWDAEIGKAKSFLGYPN